jgi:isopentenyl phosphate kinase
MMRHDELFIIKVGGSLITDKSTPFTARPEYITNFAKELNEVCQTFPEARILLGNGGGSYAHFPADTYGLRQGAKTPQGFYGMCLTRNSVQQLNTMVCAALLDAKLPAFPIAPSSTFTSHDKKLDDVHMAPILQLLDHNCIPVMYGDMILDSTRGTTIFGTEKVLLAYLPALRKHFARITVVIMSGADGVLDEHGQTIPELAPDQPVMVHSALSHDVTGGITGKVEAARQAAIIADRVQLIGGHIPGTLLQALQGKAIGTHVLPAN